MAGREDSIAVRNVLEGTLSADNAMATSVGTAFDPAYALVDEAGAQIVLHINSSDYKMYAQLKDKSGNLIYTSNIIDLPLETMVVNGRYDSVTKEVVLTLDNGNEIRFSVADLVQGLVSTEQLASTLESYVQFTDYATTSKGGVIKLSNGKGTSISNGVLTAQDIAYSNYGNLNNNGFISKGTLENVITGKNLETANNKVTSVSASSTDIQYPSAKLFYDTQKTQNDDIDELQDSIFGDDTIDDEGEVIAFDSSAEHGIIDISKYGGNTEQFTTTGKNLWFSALKQGAQSFSNGSNISNNKYVCNSTKISVEAGQTYTISAKGYTPNTSCGFVFYNNGTFVSGEGSTNTTITVPNEANQLVYNFYNNDGLSPSDLTEIQLEKNNTATPYEPYTGGSPSPNPDYPQDIHIVSGDNILKIIGKNIFNKDEASYDGSGTVILDNYITVKNNCAYALSGNIVANNDNITLYYYDKNKKQLSTAQITNNNSDKFIFTTPTNTRYLRFSLDTEVINFDTVQLELGNSVSEYEGYKENTQLISLGVENLFDKTTFTSKAGYIKNDNGIESEQSNFSYSTSYTKVLPNTTYTLTGKLVSGSGNVRVYYYDVSKNWISRTNGFGSGNNICTFTTPNNCYYIQFHYMTNDFVLDTIQLIKGDHIQYISANPIELNKISTYQDYIYKDNDRWFLHKEIGKDELDGTENWDRNKTGNYYQFYKSVNYGLGGGDVFSAYSTHFKYGNTSEGNLFYVNSAKTLIVFIRPIYNGNDVETTNDFKTMLGTLKPVVYYVLATPTDTEITDPTLIYQLNTILYSYRGSTTINQDNNDAPFILTVNGFTDTTNGRINNLNAEMLNAQALIGDINSILTTLDVGNGV